MQSPHSHAKATEVTPFRDAFTRKDGMPAVPIVLGVVGHRDVYDEGDRNTLKARLVDLFKDFTNTYQLTPLLVVTSLAEGADQIAAEAALDETLRGRVFVRVPLPFPMDSYRKSTSFGASGPPGVDDPFYQLIKDRGDVDSYVVPLPEKFVDPEPNWDKVAKERQDGPEKKLRYQCYANAGGHLARRCHALIALWDGPDGTPSQGPSGAEEHVAFKLKGRPPEHYPWADAEPLGFRGERGLVIVFHTPRAKARATSGPQRTVGEMRVLVPNEKDEDWVVPAELGLLPISWSSDNGSHLFVDSGDEGSGRSSSIGTYLTQVAANSAGV